MNSSTVIIVTFFTLIGLNVIGICITAFVFASAASRSNPEKTCNNSTNVFQQHRYNRAFPTNYNNNNNFNSTNGKNRIVVGQYRCTTVEYHQEVVESQMEEN